MKFNPNIMQLCNDKEKLIVTALPRIGSSFCNRLPSIDSDWHYLRDDKKKLKKLRTYELIATVRHPVLRFRSYINSFYPKKYWNRTKIREYFTLLYDKHSFTLQLQTHIYFQQKSYQELFPKNFDKLKYLEMGDLPLLFKTNSSKWIPAAYDTEKYTKHNILLLLISHAKIFYREDIKWYKNLNKITYA